MKPFPSRSKYLLNIHFGSSYVQDTVLKSEMWLLAVAFKKDRGEDVSFSR